MAASQNKGPSISRNENFGDVSKSSSHFSFGQLLDLGIINQFGQLIGDYSRLDEELWLSDHEDVGVDTLDKGNDGLKCHFAPSHENIVDMEQPSGFVDNAVCDGGMVPVKEKSTSLKDSSQNQSQTSSPISVFQMKRSYTDVITTMHSQSICSQPTKHSGSLQFYGTTVSTKELNRESESESEYSMESSLSDETEDYIPSKQVRTRKISDLLVGSDPAVKKCMHCESTDTPQWRTGPMGRKTLCNACGVQYKHGRLFSDYRPLRSPAFDPSLHFNLPKKVQKFRMGSSSEGGPNPTPKPKKFTELRLNHGSARGPNSTPKLKKVEEMRMGNNSERDQNRAHRAKKFEELREKASNVLQSDSGEENQDFDSCPTLKRKLPKKVAKKCLHCESKDTPQWREGPMGRHTLCNACGVQYRAGRLFPEYRPLKSPTYDPSLHSHLPKKVLQMRMNNAENCATSGNHEKPA